MLSRVVEFSLTQRLLVCVLAVGLAIAGVWAYLALPIDAFPDVSTPQVKVIMKAPGMTAEEVETRITVPIELEMLGIPHKRIVRSTSKYAIADITIDFEDGTDLYWARQQVGERLATVMRDLPANAIGGLAPITTPLGEMLMFTVEAPGRSLAERRSILDWTIRPALRTLPGVADVNALGGEVRALEVVPDLAALRARGMTLASLRQALESNNRNDGAGRLRDGEEALLVRVEGRVRGPDDVASIVVGRRDGVPVRVAEVARVGWGSVTRYGAVTQNGEAEAVQGLVLGLRGANAREVVEGVKGRLGTLALPEGVQVSLFYDRGALVDRAVGTVQKALAEAVSLVLVLLLLFLGQLRAALVVALVLPMAALCTFLLMRVAGLSANLMSLGGLAIAIGMLVDAAVVVVENVVARLGASGGARLPRLHLVYRAVREVALPVGAGCLIIMLVFVPLLTLQGLEGKLFIPVALTIVFALGASLLLSLTIIPVLCSLVLGSVGHGEPWLMRQAQRAYRPMLAWVLAHPLPLLVGVLVAFFASLWAFGGVGKTFMPVLDEGDVIMQLEKLPSISLEDSVETDLAVQRRLLREVPEISRIVARVGSDELGLDPMGVNQTDTFMVFKTPREWRELGKPWLLDRLREVMAGVPGVAFSFTQPIDMRVSEMLTGARGDVAIKIFGPDIETLNGLAERIVEAVRTVPGAEDVLTVRNEGVQYYRVDVDRLAAGRFGWDVDSLAESLRIQLEGHAVGLVIDAGRRMPLIVRGGETLRRSPALFAALQIQSPEGLSVPVEAVARLVRVDGPVRVDRENARRVALVQSNVRERDLVGFVDEARRRVAEQVRLPEGYTLQWGGQFENQQRAAKRLGVVVPLSLALIFVLLFLTFRSVRQSILVFANIPLALIGGVWALWWSGEYLSVPAAVGFIALLGIAVLNGVVMVSHFNQLLAYGLPMSRIVREGAERRLRPVLMTATITAIGLVPLLFATGPGSEIQRPLAIVVIGGLASATVLTLFVLPILFDRFGVPVGQGGTERHPRGDSSARPLEPSRAPGAADSHQDLR